MIFLHTWLPYILLVAVCADYLRVGRALRRMKAVQAEIVANALGNNVLVDGVELPKPEDERWKRDKRNKFADGSPAEFLSIGAVVTDQLGRIYIEAGSSLPITEATKNYCSAVWKAYRSRVARKSIESTDNST